MPSLSLGCRWGCCGYWCWCCWCLLALPWPYWVAVWAFCLLGTCAVCAHYPRAMMQCCRRSVASGLQASDAVSLVSRLIPCSPSLWCAFYLGYWMPGWLWDVLSRIVVASPVTCLSCRKPNDPKRKMKNQKIKNGIFRVGCVVCILRPRTHQL